MAVLGYVTVILGIFFGDLWIKNRIEKNDRYDKEITTQPLHGEHNISPVPQGRGFLLIRRHHNTGAMLNLGKNRRPLVVLISVIFSLLLIAAFLLSLGRRGNVLLRTGLALLLGGAFSNTYDRLKRKYVVDYLSLNVKNESIRKIVFNISDFCIILGALLSAAGTP